ncbi:MAG: DUF5123 domain-containing protein [Bacteroidota bacterium]
MPLKTTSFLLVSVVLTTSIVSSQTNVTPGDGTLAAAILAAQPGEVLQLVGGAEYSHSSTSSIALLHKPITIQVEPGATRKAIVTGNSKYLIMIMDGAALTLRGLDIHGISNGDTAMSMLKFDGSPNPLVSKIGTFRFENCVFHDFLDNIVHGMTDVTCRGLIQDSVFIDNVIVHDAQAFLQYKHVKLRHLEMKNSTLYKIQGLGLKIGKIGYRCILANGGNKPYTSLYADSTITPAGFIDHCTMNDMGDIHGHIQIDDAFQQLTISNCIISNQDRVIGHPLISNPGALQPAVYLQDPRPDTALFIQNVGFWKTATKADAGNGSWVGGPPWNGYAFQDTLHMDPNYKDTANGDFTLPMDSPLRTCGTDGGPIGDPRWANSIDDVTQVLSSSSPASFNISQNYPNPFNPGTQFRYQVAEEAFVSIRIFNLLGMEVASLVNAMRQPGNYVELWNGSRLCSGVYFYRMQAGSFEATKKMILSK